MSLSILLITFNEEKNIKRCLDSCSFADEVILVDSYSQDKTLEIAKKYPQVKIYQNPFKNHGQQKNHALSLATSTWIFNLDADEEISPELQASILKVVNGSNQSCLYQVNRLTQYCGKWIKYGGWHPDFVSRLGKREEVQWSEPFLHEKLFSQKEKTPEVKLSGLLYHYSFPTLASQVLTNLKFAQQDAQKYQNTSLLALIFKFIFKPPFKFIECYLIKKGFLDGFFGFLIAVNAAYSMYLKCSFAIIARIKN